MIRKIFVFCFALTLSVTLFLGLANTATAAEAKTGNFKLAACFSTPIEEPWPNCIHQACLKLAKEFNLTYDMTEHIGYTDFERVVREYCERGYNIITGDAFGNEEVVRRVAKDYPKVAFIFGSGLGPVDPNFSVFDNWIHEPAYLCGVIAGKITKSNIIGVVAQMDIPEVNRIANGFITGAKEANPKAKVIGSYIGTFWDPPKTKEAALGIIESGADVMYAMIYGGIDAAKEKKIPAFGNMTDQWQLAPEYVVTSPVWDMYPTMHAAIKAVLGGYFSALNYGEYSFMRKKGSYLAPYHNWQDRLPAEVKDLVAKKTEQIMTGRFVVPVDEATARFDKR